MLERVPHVQFQAVEHHAELLDALMFPCALEEELFPSTLAAGDQAGAKPSGGAAGTSGSSAVVVAAARKPLRPRQALDGLHATLQRAEFLKREQPMVGSGFGAGSRQNEPVTGTGKQD